MEVLAIENPAFDGNQTNKDDKNGTAYQVKEGRNYEQEDIVSRILGNFWKTVDRIYEKYKRRINVGILVAIVILFLAYFIGAIHYKITYDCSGVETCNWMWCSGHGFLIIITSITFVGLVYFQIIKYYFGTTIKNAIHCPVWSTLWKIRLVRLLIYFSPIIVIIIFLAFDTSGDRGRLISLIGMVVLLLLGAVFSKHPGKINWQPVLMGLLWQFAFGLFTLRWDVGRQIFDCFGRKTTTFLEFAKAGASFVYGENLATNVFAFQVLPVIFFFSFFVQILYYWGAMQWIVMKLGWLLQSTMGTTVCESVNTAASIFLGQAESPLLIKPHIKDLTKSEIHAIMTAGFATVSGTALAAYINYGVNASHLLTATIMSAPAALCYSKLFYPETEESKTRVDNIRLEKGDETGVLDAATKGAMSGISLVLGIIANLIAFVSVVSFLDGIVGWMGELVGLTGNDKISFTFILTKIFYPLAWIMGVPTENCSDVARVVALKTVVNEFVGYAELGELIRAGKICGRAELIATYALCGFSNPSSIGIQIGALSSMASNRRSDIAEVAFRAFLAGCAVCFLTACIAGLLTNFDSEMDGLCVNSTEILTTTTELSQGF